MGPQKRVSVCLFKGLPGVVHSSPGQSITPDESSFFRPDYFRVDSCGAERIMSKPAATAPPKFYSVENRPMEAIMTGGCWLTVSELARRYRISRQAVHINVRRHRDTIATRPGPRGSVLVELGTYDAAMGKPAVAPAPIAERHERSPRELLGDAMTLLGMAWRSAFANVRRRLTRA
jgi:hypothetical protein